MIERLKVSVIIPAYNEAESIGAVIAKLREVDCDFALLDEIIVVDNGSTDVTAQCAISVGAKVCQEKERGYGVACLRGIRALNPEVDVVLFVDGDMSDFPEEWPSLVQPIASQRADFVVGSRVLGDSEEGALLPQARFGNWLATKLIRLLYGFQFSDLGPFRAIAFHKLKLLKMRDRDFGWTVEMQLKALRHGLRIIEVPVSYRRRKTGVSKVSGSIRASVLAGNKILTLIFKEYFYKVFGAAAL